MLLVEFPVAVSTAITAAFGSDAPELSMIVPAILAVVRCPVAQIGASRQRDTNRSSLEE
jgi:hypothetical protein